MGCKQVFNSVARFSLIVLVCLLVSCNVAGPKEYSEHNHSYTLSDDGYLTCSCGQSTITEPYVAFLLGKTVSSFQYMSKGSSDSFGLSVDGDEITYSNTSFAKNVVIRTTSSQSLIIDAPNDTVTHFGTAYKVTVKRVANDSFHEKAEIRSCVVVNQGHVQLETAVPEVVIESNNSEPVLVSLTTGVVVEKVQVNEGTNSNIKIEGAFDSKVKNIETEAPMTISVDTEQLEIKSENISISASGDAHIYKVVADSEVASLSISISDDAVVDGLFGFAPENVIIQQETATQACVHVWVFESEEEATPDSEGKITYICDNCHQTKTEATSKVEAGSQSFVVTEEPNGKIHANISVTKIPERENAVLITLTSTNANTDYSSAVYKWYVDYSNLVQTDIGKKKSSYEYTVTDGAIHTVTCSYSNAHGGGSVSVQVSK